MVPTPTQSKHRRGRRSRLQILKCSWLLILFMGVSYLPSATAQDAPTTRIEEDWVLQVDEPDVQQNAPQIVNCLSPFDNLTKIHGVFELNHSTYWNYTPGGMQLQTWYDDQILWWDNNHNDSPLSLSDETVTYTLAMSLNDSKLTYEVLNGTSDTWGTFGDQGHLKISHSTALTELSGYSPLTSVEHAQVGFAKNRVTRFVLKEVRFYSGDDLIQTDATERIVHEKDTSVD